MEENVFRAASEPSETPAAEERSTDVPDAAFSSSEMPPSLYRDFLRTPYVADLAEAGPVYDLPDIRRFSEDADRYIVAEVLSQGMPDTKESYKKVYDSALKELGLPEGTTLHSRLEKVAELMKIRSTISGSLKALDELKASSGKPDDKALKGYLRSRHGITYA